MGVEAVSRTETARVFTTGSVALADEWLGGAQTYLRSIGVPPNAMASIRSELLEPRQ